MRMIAFVVVGQRIKLLKAVSLSPVQVVELQAVRTLLAAAAQEEQLADAPAPLQEAAGALRQATAEQEKCAAKTAQEKKARHEIAL